ncbi:hypothetical protein, partial [Paenibacillus anseongense]|uniref:hypothetical protein n=1 Tax=Paenibacillus anseongense TaxID=2682845 RepID=UPI001C878FB5
MAAGAVLLASVGEIRAAISAKLAAVRGGVELQGSICPQKLTFGLKSVRPPNSGELLAKVTLLLE